MPPLPPSPSPSPSPLWNCLFPSLSAQDIYSLFHLNRPFKFISKSSIFMIPIVGWSMFLTGREGEDGLGGHRQVSLLSVWNWREGRVSPGGRRGKGNLGWRYAVISDFVTFIIHPSPHLQAILVSSALTGAASWSA